MQYLTLAAEHIFTFLRNLARTHQVSLCGTVVVGTPHASVTTPVPRHSPFDHLLDENAAAPTQGQREWAEWMKLYVQTEETKPVLVNEAFFIDESGEVVGSYHKRNLWHPER